MSIKEHSLKHNEIAAIFAQTEPQPKRIAYKGSNLDELLQHKRVGIVGSRAHSPYGKAVTEKIANELAARDIVIVSGLALGIDSIAHKSAVDNNSPTIAVLPCGLDSVYPRTHTFLAKRIIDTGGVLLSEYPHNTEPLPGNFIARNRLIAALSDVLVIPEAAEKSGSLHTAQFALDQGIPVMAIPGPITSNTSRGTNNLIKAGAPPITRVQDILDVLGVEEKSVQQMVFANNPEENTLLTLIAQGITDGSQMHLQSKLDLSLFNQTLTMLEISGRIKPLGNNHWTLT